MKLKRLSQDDYKCLDGDGQGGNIVEMLARKVGLENMAHLEPRIRAMAVRILGLAGVISYALAESFMPLLLQALIVDYPEVVVEVQKALYNVLLHYSSENSFDTATWNKCVSSLEEQLDVVN